MASYELVFSVEPMHCGGCVANINSLLSDSEFNNSKLSYSVSLEDKTIRFLIDDTNDSEQQLREKLKQKLSQTLKGRTISFRPPPNHHMSAGLGLITGFFWLSLAFGWLSLPLIAYQCLVGLGCVLMMYTAWPFVKSAWKALISGPSRLNMDSLFTLTGLIVLGSSIVNLFNPIFPCLLSAGLMIFGFRHLGCIFQAYLDKKMGWTRSMVHAFSNKPYRVAGGNDFKSAHLFKKDDQMICRTGDIIPVDAKVVAFTEGSRVVDSLQTGQYFASGSIKLNQEVLAGCQVETGELTLQVKEPLKSSRLAGMDELMRSIQSKDGQAAILKKSEQWLQWFIPGLLILALVTGIWVGQVYGLALAIKCVSSILVSACPCTLGLIIPMAMRMGAYKASINGIEFKSSEALQFAAQSSIFVLDYNGTLTQGKPTVSCSSELSSEFLYVIKRLEEEMLRERPSQIIGQAVKAFVEEKLTRHTPSHLELTNFSWRDGGAGARISDSQWYFGNQQLLNSLGLRVENPEPFQHYLVREREVVAILKIEDKLKPDAKFFVNTLKQNGKIVKICTGADTSTVETITRQLGLAKNDIQAEQNYRQKPDFIQSLRKQYPHKVIAMFGDNINDVPALEKSDLKIWVNNSELSSLYKPQLQNVTNIEIKGDKLSDIQTAFIVAEQTLSLIYQNLTISLVYNLIVIGVACGSLLAFGLSLPPALGVCLMILQSAILAMNVYRVLTKPIRPHSDEGVDLNRSNLTATCLQSSTI